MSLIQQLSLLAIHQVFGDRADSLVRFLGARLNDHTQRLENALRAASDRAWRCLEVALAGPSWWETCKSLLTPREEQTLARNIRAFLNGMPQAELPGDSGAFRRDCLAELRAARKAGVIPGQRLGVGDAAEEVRRFVSYGDPQRRLTEERRRLEGVAQFLRHKGYITLAAYVALRPGQGEPLLAQASRYFFRRAVESDAQLSSGLTLETIQHVGSTQQAGFDAMRAVLDGQGERLEGLLEGLHGTMVQTMEAATGARDEVRLLRDQLENQDKQLRQMAGMLAELLEQRAGESQSTNTVPLLRAPAAPTISLVTAVSAEATGEWEQVRQLLAKCKAVTPLEQQARPELARAITEFTLTARQYERTRKTFLNLQPPEEELSALPVYPAPQTIDVQSVKQSGGRLISSIFRSCDELAAEARPEEVPQGQRLPRRLLSPLFDERLDDEAS